MTNLLNMESGNSRQPEITRCFYQYLHSAINSVYSTIGNLLLLLPQQWKALTFWSRYLTNGTELPFAVPLNPWLGPAWIATTYSLVVKALVKTQDRKVSPASQGLGKTQVCESMVWCCGIGLLFHKECI